MKSVADAIFAERFEDLPKIDISTDIFTELWRKNGFQKDIVYVVDGCVHIEDSRVLVSDGVIAVCNGGIVIENADGAHIEGLTVKGSIRVINSKNVLIKNCRIQSSDAAISCDSDGLSVYKSKMCAPVCVSSSANDLAVQDCELVAEKLAIRATGIGAVIRDNSIVATCGYGIEAVKAANALVAKNNVIGMSACAAIRVSDSFNCAVVLNSATAIAVNDNKNVYVIKNTVDGAVEISNNNYLTADGNVFVGNDVKTENNDNFVGDNVTDVNARVEFGANEDILPHTNKDLFIGMERRETVRDLSVEGEHPVCEYILMCAERGDEVIVPPGAYHDEGEIKFTEEFGNTTVYAYGALEEKLEHTPLLMFDHTENVTVCGLTVGYSDQQCGQVHVLEKLGDGKLLVIPSAGYINDFAKSETTVFQKAFFDIFADRAMYNWTPADHRSYSPNDDGTGIVDMGENTLYNDINVGDVLACRLLMGKCGSNIKIWSSRKILVKDLVLYGITGDFAVNSEGDCDDTVLERMHVAVDNGRVVDKETYDRYRAVEEQYGVDLEMRCDERGYYRGSPSRICTADATHVFTCLHGTYAISCLFENMSDDGSNQRGDSSRLHDIVDNGDGTVTLTYKNLQCWYRFERFKFRQGGLCMPFKKGHRVYVYTNEGETVCDTEALTPTAGGDELVSYELRGRDCAYRPHTVTVAADAINWDALYFDGAAKQKPRYDLSDCDYVMDNKVLVDNLSRNSTGFVFENVLIQNERARGILVKAVDAKIANCTFRNVAQTGVKISNEIIWGESTVAKNISITGCLFEHVGYDRRDYKATYNAPVSVYNEIGGSAFNEKGMLCSGIKIDKCKFTGNENKYAVYAWNAKDISVTNCVFDDTVGDEQGVAVYVKQAMNVKLENNTYGYSHSDNVKDFVVAEDARNIFGSDVTDENGDHLIPDTI
jgi:hypothetical protein